LASHKSKALAEFEEERLEVFDDRRFDIGFMKLGLVWDVAFRIICRSVSEIFGVVSDLLNHLRETGA
jgi:hypothetical protein